MSSQHSRATTPHVELLELTQQLTPSKSPQSTRKILLNIQSIANEATEYYGVLKRKFADVTNQLENAQPQRKRRSRHRRAEQAGDGVENPATIKSRVRAAGRHFVIEYGLFLFTDVHSLLQTEEDPTFEEDSEFDSGESCIQGQLRDVIALLPEDARPQRKQEWLGDSFGDGMHSQRSRIKTRLRHESLAHIVKDVKFLDGDEIHLNDFASAASRFNTFAKRIGYQEATEDAAAFYSPLKAEILYEDYDGTMNTTKIFRGPVPLKIYASLIRGPKGVKGLFERTPVLPVSNVIQRVYHIERTTPAAVATCNVLAIWHFSADTHLTSSGDETKIDYKFLYRTFLRQICTGLRYQAGWALELLRYWDSVLFPNAEHSNRQAVRADISEMDAAFRAAARGRKGEGEGSSPRPQPSTSSQSDNSAEPQSSAPRSSNLQRPTRRR
ncbi:hypothetical protein B0H19DRAFT_1242676 [Mycena capillaripes]|nr:hypothetical protein B0H19DRAFT_1242676 [Mycena capillaripes]